MNLTVMKPYYENRFKLEGIDFPIHCVIGKTETHAKRMIAPHYHEYIEIVYSIESDCDVYLDGKIQNLKTGDLLIINSGEHHDFIYTHEHSHLIIIKVLPELLYSSDCSFWEMKYTIPFFIENTDTKRHFTKTEIGSDYIHDTAARILDEFLGRDYGYELSMRTDVLKIFLWVIRYWHNNELDTVDCFDYSDEIWRIIQSALEYISHNYACLTETEVARHCNLSYSYFSRTFKKVMHQSFSEYINHYRITKAEYLLTSTEKSVTEIAGIVGFSTPSYFIHQFKLKNNISPKQFRTNVITSNQSLK